jgi:hypoxanthine phosphoribosyltransferase
MSANKYDVILGVSNGGIIPARLIAREIGINHIILIPVRNRKLHKEEMSPLYKGKKYLIVDDIYDSGKTYSKIRRVTRMFDCDFAFLISRYKYTDESVSPSPFMIMLTPSSGALLDGF